MRIFIFVFIVLVGLSSPAFAKHEPGHDALVDAAHRITVQINGLVCDFCARALEKVFGKREGVTGVDVNLDTKLITIGLSKGAELDDETVASLIMDAGYNVVKISR